MKATRDKLAEKLEKDGIETRNFFYPLHEMPIIPKICKSYVYRIVKDF